MSCSLGGCGCNEWIGDHHRPCHAAHATAIMTADCGGAVPEPGAQLSPVNLLITNTVDCRRSSYNLFFFWLEIGAVRVPAPLHLMASATLAFAAMPCHAILELHARICVCCLVFEGNKILSTKKVGRAMERVNERTSSIHFTTLLDAVWVFAWTSLHQQIQDCK